MRLVHVALESGDHPGLGQNIADSVHRTLAEEFELPADGKRFRIVSEPAVADPAPRPGTLANAAPSVVILIYLLDRIGERAKRRLFGRIAERLASEFGTAPEALAVGIIETPRTSWSFGYGEAHYRSLMAYQRP
jgi:hypothetical protein